MTARRWDRTKRNPHGTEAAEPKQAATPMRGGSHVAPGKVKRWADMTPAERANVVAQLRGKKA